MTLFRVAAAAPRWRHVVTTFAQMLVFWVVFLAVLPWLVRWFARAWDAPHWDAVWLAGCGIGAFVACSGLGVASAWTLSTRGRGTPLPLATARDLVVAGPYRCVRNPMAVAGIGQGIAVGLWLGEPLVVAYALAGAVLWHCAVRPAEERDLLLRFGETYARYRAAVPLWLPRLRPYRG